MKISNAPHLIILGILALAPQISRSIDLQENGGAESFAQGNAGIAQAKGGSLPFFNPAAISAYSGGILSLHGAFPVQKTNDPDQQSGAFSFIKAEDPQSAPWALFGVYQSTESVSRNAAVGLNLSRPIWETEEKGLFIGANLIYQNNERRGPSGGDKTSFGLDAGVLYQASSRLSFGLVGENLTSPKKDFGSDKNSPFSVGGGLAYRFGSFSSLSFDVKGTEGEEEWDPRGGLETGFFNDAVGVRLGSNKDFFTTGAGLNMGAFSLDYAYAYPYQLSKNDRKHVVSLAYEWAPGKQSDLSYETTSEEDPFEDEFETREESSDLTTLSEKEKKGLIKIIEKYRRRSDLPIGPEDEVTITVKNHPELGAIETVDAWGFIEIPFIEEMKVSGLAPVELANRLESIYTGFVKEPEVKVAVTQFNSRSILVLGAVNNPGEIDLKETRPTLRDAIVQAGLPTNRAAEWRTFLIRQTEDGPLYYRINLARVLYRGKLDNNVVLESGDVIYVPMTILDKIATFIGRLVSPVVGAVTGIFGVSN